MGFFKLGEAFKEVTSSVGAKKTALAGAKLIGKTAFNIGKLAVEEVAKNNEKTSKKYLERKDISDEQRERATEIHEASKETRINNDIKNLEADISGLEDFIDNYSDFTSEDLQQKAKTLNLNPDNPRSDAEGKISSLKYKIQKLERELDSL